MKFVDKYVTGFYQLIHNKKVSLPESSNFTAGYLMALLNVIVTKYMMSADISQLYNFIHREKGPAEYKNELKEFGDAITALKSSGLDDTPYFKGVYYYVCSVYQALYNLFVLYEPRDGKVTLEGLLNLENLPSCEANTVLFVPYFTGQAEKLDTDDHKKTAIRDLKQYALNAKAGTVICKAYMKINDSVESYNEVYKAYWEDDTKSANEADNYYWDNLQFIGEDDSKEAKKKEEQAKKKEELSEDEEFKNDKELIDAWRKIGWVNGLMSPAVTSILESLTTLYKSGFDGLPNAGIFLYNGEKGAPLVAVKCSQETDGTTKVSEWNDKDSGYAMDLKLVRTLNQYLPSLTPIEDVDVTTGFPTYETLKNAQGILKQAHLMFQTANVKYSGNTFGTGKRNKNSIRRWIRETKNTTPIDWLKSEANANTIRLTHWSEVKNWYKWVLENTLYRYFDEVGQKPATADPDIIGQVIDLFALKLKNVVTIAERVSKKDTLQTTEIRIFSDTQYNLKELADAIAKALNTGNSTNTLTEFREDGDQINAIRITYNKSDKNNDTLFAYEMAESIRSSGNVPSWGHVLLGRNPNGSFFFWDKFMTGQMGCDRVYAIYAGSGAGKGNMTLTLCAAALADNRQLFYIDGKPDSGGAIANLAWSRGKEMFMFDGQPTGAGESFSGLIENHTACCKVRQPDESLAYSKDLPSGKLFNSEEITLEFLGVCRYLKCIALCLDILTHRAKNNPAFEKDNFQIWVIDEMTSMSAHERAIRIAFARYLLSNGFDKIARTIDDKSKTPVLVGFKFGKDLNEALEKDENVKFIYNWLNWVKSLQNKILNLSKIGLRMANANIIFIFQEASWLSDDEDGKFTILAQLVKVLQCRKIIGKNGLQNECSTFGTGFTKATEWAQTIQKKPGWWAISDASDISRQGATATIFQPYSIWGYPKEKGDIGDTHNFLSYYMNELVGNPDAIANTLQSAYDYAEKAVLTLSENKLISPVKSLKEYVYGVSNFEVPDTNFDPALLSSGDDVEKEDPYNKPISDGEDDETPGGMPLGGGTPYAPDGSGNDENLLTDEDIARLLNPDGTPGQPQPQGQPQGGTPTQQPQGQPVYRPDGSQVPQEQPIEQPDISPEELANLLNNLQNNKPQGQGGTPTQQPQRQPGQPQGQPGQPQDYQGLNKIKLEQLVKALMAKDNAKVIYQDKNGRLIIDTKQADPENVKSVNEKNFIDTNVKIDNNVFKTDNLKKIKRSLYATWEYLLSEILRDAGGKGAVRQIVMDSNDVHVNGKKVGHHCFENDFIHSLEDFVYLPDIFKKFPALTEIILSQPMMNLLNDQLDDVIVKASIKQGKELSMPEYLLKTYPNLNKIINGTARQYFTRRDLLNTTKDRAQRIREQLEEQKARQAQGKAIDKIKRTYNNNNGKVQDKAQRLSSSRGSSNKPQYRFGFIGKAIYSVFDKISA